MKTTVEIADALLAEVRILMERDNMTLKSLVELGLRRVVADAKREKKPVPPRIVTFGGDGLQPGVNGFQDMLELTYAGRGG